MLTKKDILFILKEFDNKEAARPFVINTLPFALEAQTQGVIDTLRRGFSKEGALNSSLIEFVIYTYLFKMYFPNIKFVELISFTFNCLFKTPLKGTIKHYIVGLFLRIQEEGVKINFEDSPSKNSFLQSIVSSFDKKLKKAFATRGLDYYTLL